MVFNMNEPFGRSLHFDIYHEYMKELEENNIIMQYDWYSSINFIMTDTLS